MQPIRILAMVSIACLCANAALAKGKLGFDIGLNASSLHYEHPDVVPIRDWDRHWRPLPVLGLTYEVPGNGPLGLVTGLHYIQHGNRVRLPSAYLIREIRFLHHYVAVPVLLSWRPSPSRLFHVAAGTEVGVSLGAEVVTEFIGQGRRETQQVGDEMDPFDFSLDVQAGLELPLGGQLAAVTLRYSHGLNGVAKKESWASDWSTRGLQGLIGLRW